MKQPTGALVSAVDRRRPGRQGGPQGGRRRPGGQRHRHRACRCARLPAGDAADRQHGRTCRSCARARTRAIDDRARAGAGRRVATRRSLIKGRSPFAGAKVADLSPRLAAEARHARPTRPGVAVVDIDRGFAGRPASASCRATSCARSTAQAIDSRRAARGRSPRQQTRWWRFTVERDGQTAAPGAALLMADLFAPDVRSSREPGRPLADRLRPASLGEVVGQEHLTGAGRRADAHDRARARSAR